jgi:hypothetical protein
MGLHSPKPSVAQRWTAGKVGLSLSIAALVGMFVASILMMIATSDHLGRHTREIAAVVWGILILLNILCGVAGLVRSLVGLSHNACCVMSIAGTVISSLVLVVNFTLLLIGSPAALEQYHHL